MGHDKVATGRWPIYGGQNEWGKAVLGLAKVAFIERWPLYGGQNEWKSSIGARKGGLYGEVAFL